MSRLETILNALKRFYGALPPPPRDPFTLFVWEVLSVHSTPRKRDAALAALKRIRALTPDAMWRAPQKKLEQSVALAGPYTENRLQALRTGVDLFRRSPRLPAVIRGPLPAARRALKPFPQLGETGAHRMLLFAADHPILPVDARVSRVGRRLGYGEREPRFQEAGPVGIGRRWRRSCPPSVDAFRRAFLYLSHHGGATCTKATRTVGVPSAARLSGGTKTVAPLLIVVAEWLWVDGRLQSHSALAVTPSAVSDLLLRSVLTCSQDLLASAPRRLVQLIGRMA